MSATVTALDTTVLEVDMRHTLLLFAKALDYVGVDDCHHGHRVAYISACCAEKLGWDPVKVQKSFFSGFIHDCGVSKSREHLDLLAEMAPETAGAHCERGYTALMQCSILHAFSNIVRFHHTHWEELVQQDIPEDDRDVAALVFLADRVDFLRAGSVAGLQDDLVTLHKVSIGESIRAKAGTMFCPEMVEVMCELIDTDGFWFKMDVNHIEMMAQSFDADEWYNQKLSIEQITEVATFLAKIVDAKSPFTYEHSIRVAQLAHYLGGKMHLPSQTRDLLYVAGLVHDIGKLRTPDELLNKPAALTPEEYTYVKRHTIDTEFALNKVFPNSKICEWASNHHEFIDGSGYPYQKKGDLLDVPSRIITFCDVYQALSQDRPYRGRMTMEEKMEIISKMVTQRKLDKEVFRHAIENLDEFDEIACG
ncbi:HD domain-containing phosphohydrolase [Enterovibrio paralichthyis]|uniref:HD domain-containing phosphohydrolase n=1 Tax=Enterovibrio paralichthyis TaxID=2853805 RepID=UPI001C4665C2|nr:HD domain-containing phosphohydrolase [Enterovibrio paralichthyis]MBV7298064.1 HD domain-containing protein [Enterovibrio paralichthyis]